MRKDRLKKDLEAQRIDVIAINEDANGLRASVTFAGSKSQLTDRLPKPYYIESAHESRAHTVAMIRHRR